MFCCLATKDKRGMHLSEARLDVKETAQHEKSGCMVCALELCCHSAVCQKARTDIHPRN